MVICGFFFSFFGDLFNFSSLPMLKPRPHLITLSPMKVEKENQQQLAYLNHSGSILSGWILLRTQAIIIRPRLKRRMVTMTILHI